MTEQQPTRDDPTAWTCGCGERTSVRHWLQRGGVMVHDPEAAFREAAGIEEPEPDESVNEASHDVPPAAVAREPAVLRFDSQDELEEYVETALNENGVDPTVALIDSNGDALTAHRTAPGGDGYAFEYDLGRLSDTGQRHCCTCNEHLHNECPELDWSWTPKFPVWVLEAAKVGA